MKSYPGNYDKKSNFCAEFQGEIDLPNLKNMQKRIETILGLPFFDKKAKDKTKVQLWCWLEERGKRRYYLSAALERRGCKLGSRKNQEAVFTLWEYDETDCLFMRIPDEVWALEDAAAGALIRKAYEELLPFERRRFGFVAGGVSELPFEQDQKERFTYCNTRKQKVDGEKEPTDYYRRAAAFFARNPSEITRFSEWLKESHDHPEKDLNGAYKDLYSWTEREGTEAQLAQDILLASYGCSYNIPELKPSMEELKQWKRRLL